MFLPRAGLIDFLISSQAAKRVGLEFVAHEGLSGTARIADKSGRHNSSKLTGEEKHLWLAFKLHLQP
jgi:hypothetical protein